MPRLVDVDALRERCDHDHELLTEVVKLFENTCQQATSEIIEGLKQSDQSRVVSATHRLKGAVLNMCAASVCERCQEMEMNARKSNLGLVHAQFPELDLELTTLRNELELLCSDSR